MYGCGTVQFYVEFLVGVPVCCGVAAAPAFHGAGAAAGPAIAALYVSATSLVAVNWLAGVAVSLSLLAFVGAMMSSRSRVSESGG